MNTKIAIIGAGISGISVAKLLKEIGCDVIVFEKEKQIGGLVKCSIEGNVLFHRVGGHVFNTRIQKVDDWFWRNFNKDKEFVLTKRNAQIWMNNNYIGYPIENYLYKLNGTQISKIISELLLINSLVSKDIKRNENIDNFDNFLKSNFGNTLYELYFKPYNYKLWQTELTSIPLPWLEDKLPMPKVSDIFLNNITKKEEQNMVHSSFFYPLKGGSSFIVEKLSNNICIERNSDINLIQYIENKWKINEKFYDSVIFTGDVRTLHDIIQINDQNVINCCNKVKHLISNGTSNALCYVDDSDLSWLYLPELNTKSHRIIFTGNFSPNNNSDKRLTCTVEFSGIVSEKKMKETLVNLPGNLKPIAFNNEPNSYVIQQMDTRSLISNLKSSLKPYKFYLLGRFAEWEYYNMDKAIEAAINLTENSFKI